MSAKVYSMACNVILCKHGSATKAYRKRATARRFRRLSKRMLEDAPPRRTTTGWVN